VVTIIAVPTWLDIATIVVAALGGALYAHRRGVTITGALLISISAGLGGGLLRDVLLDVGPPRAITDPGYLIAATGAAVAGLLFARWSGRIGWPLLLLDSLALGMFAVVGVERTLAAQYPAPSAILIGVIAASAGGIIRDLLTGDAPAMMQAGPWDASAALVGSALMVALVAGGDVPTRIVEWPTIFTIMLIAVLSAQLKWRAPMASDLEPLIDAPVAAVRRVAGRREPGTPEPVGTMTSGATTNRERDRLVRHRLRRASEKEDAGN
jgi:uncharacterized membrane protein YeiH